MSSEGDETVENPPGFPFILDPFEDADGDGIPDVFTGGPVRAPKVEVPDTAPEPETKSSSTQHETAPPPPPPEPEPAPRPAPRRPKVEHTPERNDTTAPEHHDVPNVPDTPEITALAERAAELRHQFEERSGKEELEGAKNLDAVQDQIQATEARVKDAQTELQSHEGQVTEIQQKIDKMEGDASKAQAAGHSRDAEELLEGVAKQRILLGLEKDLAESSRSEVADATQQIAGLTQQRDAGSASLSAVRAQRPATERAIDALEDKVRYERESAAQHANADELDREADELRAQGDSAAADARAQEASRARAAADAAHTQAENLTVDEKALESLGPGSSDLGDVASVPDTPEITALAERAAELRAAYLDTIAHDADGNERIDVFKQKLAAEDDATRAKQGADANREQAQNARSKADELEQKAVVAEAAGRPQEAAELREDAQADRALASAADARVARFQTEAETHQQRVDELDKRHEVLSARETTDSADLDAAEKAVDALEDRVRLLRDANTQQNLAETYAQDALKLRSEGRTEDAAAREQLAAQARAAASSAQAQADAQPVDEHALEILDRTSGGVEPAAGSDSQPQPGDDDPRTITMDPFYVDGDDDAGSPDPNVDPSDDSDLDPAGGAVTPPPLAPFEPIEVTSDAPAAEAQIWDEEVPDDDSIPTTVAAETSAPDDGGAFGATEDNAWEAPSDDGLSLVNDESSFTTDESTA